MLEIENVEDSFLELISDCFFVDGEPANTCPQIIKPIHDHPRLPSLRRVSLDKIYFKNRDVSERDKPGVFNIGSATIAPLEDGESLIALGMDIDGSTQIGDFLEVALSPEGLIFKSEHGSVQLTLKEISLMIQKNVKIE